MSMKKLLDVRVIARRRLSPRAACWAPAGSVPSPRARTRSPLEQGANGRRDKQKGRGCE